MSSPTKVILSGEELSLVNNSEWIHTKQRILETISGLFRDFIPVINDEILKQIKEEIHSYPPKIAKGENYKGLPYLMMDYPRLFKSEDTFAVRTMFWWGNYISITLHLAGESHVRLTPVIKRKPLEYFDGFFIQKDNDPWQHQVFAPFYVPVTNLEIGNDPFLKLALKLDIAEINNSVIFLEDGYKKIGRLLA